MGSVSTRMLAAHRKCRVCSEMVAYATLWSTSSLTQQVISRKEKLDFSLALRYGIYGCFVAAPMSHLWMSLTNKVYPSVTLYYSIEKTFLGQMIYAPVMLGVFLYGMSLLEGKSNESAISEVQNKYLSTYVIGMCIWPLAQTINYTFIPPRNQVFYTGIVSFMWTVFLAFIKQMSVEDFRIGTKLHKSGNKVLNS